MLICRIDPLRESSGFQISVSQSGFQFPQKPLETSDWKSGVVFTGPGYVFSPSRFYLDPSDIYTDGHPISLLFPVALGGGMRKMRRLLPGSADGRWS